MSNQSSSTPANSSSFLPLPLDIAPKPVRRREKVQLSCTLCRQKKLKCDRTNPCRSCVGRGLASSCTYVVPPSTHVQRKNQVSVSGIQNKINQLEGLVVSLMGTINASKQAEQQRPSSVETTSSSSIVPSASREQLSPPRLETKETEETEDLSETFGRISLDKGETKYVSNAHWTALLDGIAELKDHFEDTESRQQSPITSQADDDVRGPDLLFGCRNYASREEILAAVPKREITDKLVSQFFIRMEMASAIIHRPTFLKEYERFWDNPNKAPVMWLGLLLCALCLSIELERFGFRGDDWDPIQDSARPVKPDQLALASVFREKVVQCLVLGNYTKSGPYTIQTLALYITTEHFRSQDMQVTSWILTGTIVRLAMRMGYHRDATHFPRISTFHGEMRRRHWGMLVQLDLMMSSAVGLPRMIREGEADTAEPRNLLDEDFDENCIELPPARPPTDMTPMLHMVARTRLLRVLTKISDQINLTKPPSYAEIMDLDELLHKARAEIPAGLKMQPLHQSMNLPPDVLLRRIYMDIVYHSACCNLHRKYLVPSRADPRYQYSHDTCVNSALQVIEYQSILHEMMKAGGILFHDKWKLHALVTQDCLLAGTILCLELDCILKSGDAQGEAGMKEKIEKALLGSYKIWLKTSGVSREAHKASEAIRIVLTKSKGVAMATQEQSGQSAAEPLAAGGNNYGAQAGIGTTALPDIQPFTVESQVPFSAFSAFPTMPMSNQADPLSLNSSYSNSANSFGWENWDTAQLHRQDDMDDFFNIEYDPNVFDESLWMDVKL